MNDTIAYIFQLNRNIYIVSAENEERAWLQLQNKLSWNMKKVKQCCKLLANNGDNSIIKVKL